MALLRIQLTTGREIALRQVIQRETYADMMIGSPNRRVNDFLLNQLERQAHEVLGEQPAFIIKPELASTDQIAEVLPSIVCIGDFKSHTTAASGEATQSALSIVWFEDSIEPHLQSART